MKRKTLVKWQDATYDIEDREPELKAEDERYREVITKQSYWNWVHHSGKATKGAEDFMEPLQANADTLTSDGGFEFGQGEAQPRASRIIMDQAIKSLSPKQREVWKLCMSSSKPKTEEEAANILGVTQQAVSKRLKEAIKSVTQFCEAHLDLVKGREDESCNPNEGLNG